MFSSKRKLTLALTGLTCLAMAGGALAQTATPHDAAGVDLTSYLSAGKAQGKPAGEAPVAAGAQDPLAAIAGMQVHANDVAQDSATTTGTCDSYFTTSQSLSTTLGTAFTAMSSRNMTAAAAALPALQTQLNALPATEIKAEVCNGNHINAYSVHQYLDLSTLRAHGADNGFPANLPIVKQPELNQGSLAYAVGWIKFEQKDFSGALAAYGKGLAMFPYSHELQNEYMATLVQLQDGQGTLNYADSVLGGTFDLNDTERGKVYAARALGLIFLGRLAEADDSLTISLRYSYSDDIAQVQASVRQAMTTQK